MATSGTEIGIFTERLVCDLTCSLVDVDYVNAL